MVKQSLNMTNSIDKKPSIIRQIMDEVDDLDEGAKKLLLLQLKKESLLDKYKRLDDEIAKSGEIMSESEIDELVSETRKNMYEEKIRS